MNVTERAAREAKIWDDQALQPAAYAAAISHANWGPPRVRRNKFIAAAVADLGDKSVLEIGSQAWESTLRRFGVAPRELVCINISQTELDHGRRTAEEFGYPAQFRIADAHHMDFPDASFDFVYGVAILHHLDFPVALREIARVTKPGGRILFVEPLRLNPVAQLARFLTPRARTPDERPLGREEFRVIERYFETRHLCTELFSVPAALLSGVLFRDASNPLTRAVDRLDHALFRLVPAIGPFYRTVTIYGTKRA